MSFTTEEKQEFFENNKDMILNRWNNKGGVMSEIIEEMLEETKAKFDNFIVLDNSNTDIYSYLQNRSNILFVKPVQAGKTADVLKVVSIFTRTMLLSLCLIKTQLLLDRLIRERVSLDMMLKTFVRLTISCQPIITS